MGKKITGVVLGVTGIVLAVGTAGAVPAAQTSVEQAAAGRNVMTADATSQPKVKQGAAGTNVRINDASRGAASVTDVKVKKGATPSTPTKLELSSQGNPTVKQGSTPGGQAGTALAGKATQRANPNVKSGAASGGAVAQEVIKR